MPVVPNFYTSHQWVRELKRRGQRTIWGIYFRLDDDEPVSVGHYNQKHVRMTAAEASHMIMHAPDVRGYEVIIPHAIGRKAIYRARRLPHVLGWRYYPNAHQRRPCGCPACLGRGEIKSQRIRQRWENNL